MKKNIINAVCTSLSGNKDLINRLTDLISYMDNKMQENALDILMGSAEDLNPSAGIKFNYKGTSKRNFKILSYKYNPLTGLVEVKYEFEDLNNRYFKSVEDVAKNGPSKLYPDAEFSYETKIWIHETRCEQFPIESWNNKSLKVY